MQPLNPDEIRRTVQLALAEDIGDGDVTTLATVPENSITVRPLETPAIRKPCDCSQVVMV